MLLNQNQRRWIATILLLASTVMYVLLEFEFEGLSLRTYQFVFLLAHVMALLFVSAHYTRQKLLTHALVGISIGLLIASILIKIQHWPGSGLYLMGALLCGVAGHLISFFANPQKDWPHIVFISYILLMGALFVYMYNYGQVEDCFLAAQTLLWASFIGVWLRENRIENRQNHLS